MKVTNDDIIRQAAAQAARRSEKTAAGRFDDILRKTVEEKIASEKTSVGNLSAVQGSAPIDTASLLGIDTSQIIEGTERLLSTLEEFQTKLGDESIPLDDLSPLIQKMDQQKDLLAPSLDTPVRIGPAQGCCQQGTCRLLRGGGKIQAGRLPVRSPGIGLVSRSPFSF